MAKFIVLDGGDGSGTTTQQGLINDYLASKGLQVLCTKNPSKGVYGLQLRKYLLDHPLRAGNEVAYQRAMFGLFLADRREMQDREVRPALESGREVVCDRWSYSTLVYQPMNSGIGFDEILSVHASDGIMTPDLSLIFVGDPKILMGRVLSRGENLQVFETLELQKRVDRAYRGLGERLGHNIVYIDAEPPVDKVFQQVKSEIDKLYDWRDAA